MIPCRRILKPEHAPHRFLLRIRQYVAALLPVPLSMLQKDRWVLATSGRSVLLSTAQMPWMQCASSPYDDADLYEKEFQLRREQGNYFYQGRWLTAEEFSQVVQQQRRKRKILLLDLWLFYGAMAVVALLLLWMLRLFIAA